MKGIRQEKHPAGKCVRRQRSPYRGKIMLQIDYIHVRNVVFGEKTELRDGTLILNRQELTRIADSAVFSNLQIELVRPGESCRILGIHDCMQPRCKADNPDVSYPGMLGNMGTVGEGRTVALKGVLISEIYYAPCNIKYYLDMGGPCAEYSNFSRHCHIIIDAKPADGVSTPVYTEELKKASLRLNVFLARKAIGMAPDETEIFDPDKEVDPSLPRVAYLVTHMAAGDNWNFFLYGQSAEKMLPVVVQPTEILDGAMLWRYWEPNYYLQNEVYIRTLLRRHGRDINFVGMVINNNVTRIDSKKALTMMAVQLCRKTLRADCLVINKSGMGHSQIDSMMAYKWSETFGMPAVISLSAVSNDAPSDMLIVSDPSVDAAVNSGRNFILHHPKVERVIGEQAHVPSLEGLDVRGPFTHSTNFAYLGIWSQLGDYYLTTDRDLPFS